MSSADRGFDTLVPPWDDQELVEEQDAIDRVNAIVDGAKTSESRATARLAVIAIGNYIWQSQRWTEFTSTANKALDKLEDKLSRRWG